MTISTPPTQQRSPRFGAVALGLHSLRLPHPMDHGILRVFAITAAVLVAAAIAGFLALCVLTVIMRFMI
jgi:hypothetical protein